MCGGLYLWQLSMQVKMWVNLNGKELNKFFFSVKFNFKQFIDIIEHFIKINEKQDL